MEKYKQLIAKAQEPMTDNEYLEQYISDMNLFYHNKLWSIRNTASITTGVSMPAIHSHGLKNKTELLGLDYYGLINVIPKLDENDAKILYQQDRNIEQERYTLTLLHINEYHVGGIPIRCTRSAIINPATNNVLGTLNDAIRFKPNFGLKNILDIHGIRFGKHLDVDLSNNPSKFELTGIEREVLFCVCLGINQRKDVANFLSVLYKKNVNPETTVHDAFRRLYRKLDCNTTMQLLEFAVYNSLHLQIPQAFLPTGSYTIR